MALALFVVFLTNLYPVTAMKCHECKGATMVPKDVADKIASLNLSDTTQVMGDCEANDASSMCTEGAYCTKKIIKYIARLGQQNLAWETYTKGCADVREDNGEVPDIQCYEIEPKTFKDYNKTETHCYCKDIFCNHSSPTSLYFAIYIVPFVPLLSFIK
ncbi:unnamed protein product [Cylicocyclus nassatus]|uniref:Protein quiver n=1 Tax=Cylicocyclus nassatus TaxID=53992 RepID=A0AA36HDA4_CYLNA|nr:unnamed protein product [Cylicocyclus nassatus]